VASVDAGLRMPQVTITSARQTDTHPLDYYRLLAAMSRSDYKRVAKALPFVESGTVRFPAADWSQRGSQDERLPLGTHIQSAKLHGMVLWRVFKLTPTKAESQMQIHNDNTVPVFVELDFGRADLGNGAYAALAPGETAIWSWHPTFCVPTLPNRPLARLADGCMHYNILGATVHVRMLKE